MIGCEFGLCPRPAEFEVTVPSASTATRVDQLRVCGLHVTPVATWGVPQPAEPRIRLLRPDAA